jgi:DNA invertase Pin-like site-specific DNA recombinase
MVVKVAKRVVAYYRVSTERQGKSKLGLEAQQTAVEAYAQQQGATIIKAYTEVESGKKANRPELAKAIAHARMTKATLVIAKLDRLARNVAFLSSLMESGVDFKACDQPHADRFTVHILAAVAEKEAKDISDRTKAALAAYKARGGKLGSARPECKDNMSKAAQTRGRALGAQAIHEQAVAHYADLRPILIQLRAEGKSLRDIAHHLNQEGYTTKRGKPWNHVQVKHVLERE